LLVRREDTTKLRAGSETLVSLGGDNAEQRKGGGSADNTEGLHLS
jgi:hypothetical protein